MHTTVKGFKDDVESAHFNLSPYAGVEKILCDQWTQKVSVRGNLKPENVLKQVRRVKKEAQLLQHSKQF